MLHFKSLISRCNTSVSNKLLGPQKETGKLERKGRGRGKEKYPAELLAPPHMRCSINISLIKSAKRTKCTQLTRISKLWTPKTKKLLLIQQIWDLMLWTKGCWKGRVPSTNGISFWEICVTELPPGVLLGWVLFLVFGFGFWFWSRSSPGMQVGHALP